MSAKPWLEAPSKDGGNGPFMHICTKWPEGEKNKRSDTEYNCMSTGVVSWRVFLLIKAVSEGGILKGWEEGGAHRSDASSPRQSAKNMQRVVYRPSSCNWKSLKSI